MNRDDAERRLRLFQRGHESALVQLASHAALPVVLDPDFVHLLRVNYFLDPPVTLPYAAEAELLLSPLCTEVDQGLYAIDPGLRDVLLLHLIGEYGSGRLHDVARLLWEYGQRGARWSDRPGLPEAQQLSALNFIDPARAQDWLARAEEASGGTAVDERWFVTIRQDLKSRATAVQRAQEQADAGADEWPQQAARPAYPEVVRDIAPPDRPGLLGRDAELADLARFCLAPDGSPYMWLQAPSWAGKSALLSTFVLRPPPEVAEQVRIISFFITAQFAGQNTREAFTEVLLEQLAALLGLSLPTFLPGATKEAYLLDLFSRAASDCKNAGMRLVLVVDGLDEDRGITTGPDARSIAGLLPASPPDGMRVIVAGRPDPPIPDDVSHRHPLRDPAIIRILSSSPHAADNLRIARQELRRLLQGSKTEQDVLGLLTAARGGLSKDDLVSLTGAPPREIEEILGTSTGRIYIRRPSRWAPGSGPEIYLLAHEEIAASASQYLGDRLASYRNQLNKWAQVYRDSNWPPDTPEYLLSGYFRLLQDLSDLPRMLALALDPARQHRILALTGNDDTTLAEIAAIADYVLGGPHPDESVLTQLMNLLDDIGQRNVTIPARLPAAWLALGQVSRAEATAHAIISPDSRAVALAQIARTLAQADQHQRAAATSAQAEAAARSITDPGTRRRVLAEIAGIIATARLHEQGAPATSPVTTPEAFPVSDEIIQSGRRGRVIWAGELQMDIEPAMIETQRAAFTVGVGASMPFRPGRDPEDKRITDSEGRVLCRDRFEVLVVRGQKADANQVVTRIYKPVTENQDNIKIQLYRTAATTAEYVTDPEVEALTSLSISLSELMILPKSMRQIEVAIYFGRIPMRIEARNVAMSSSPSHQDDQQPEAGVVSSSQGHAFISYVREDSSEVDELQGMLEAAGIPVWRDTAGLWPGEDWRTKIRDAITRDALVFIVCFSSNSIARQRSYQNEELLLAIDYLRRRPHDLWLIPVRFDDCDIPDFDLGAGRTLASIQRADLFGANRTLTAGRLIEAVQQLLRRPEVAVSDRLAVSVQDGRNPLEGERVSGRTNPMRFRILGPLEVLSPNGWTAISASKWRSLLACLLVRPGQLVSTDLLIDELWGENPPERAHNLVSIYVRQLRKVIGDAEGRVLVYRAPGYLLRLSPGDLDLQEFEALFADGSNALAHGDVQRAAALLSDALALWRGPLLADVPPSPLLTSQADRATELWHVATELRIEADLACGRAAQVMPELRGLVQEHPMRERLWLLLMRALEDAGRRAEALEAFAQAREVIAAELGVDPGAELQRFYAELLAADTSAVSPPSSPADA